MSIEEKEGKMKIIFAPGCFDSFEGTQEELDELVKHIQEGVEDGSLLRDAIPLSDEDLRALEESGEFEKIGFVEKESKEIEIEGDDDEEEENFIPVDRDRTLH